METRENILLLGKTGDGKSSFVEYLVRQSGRPLKIQLSSDDALSFTNKNWLFSFPNYTIIDTPGLDDSQNRTQLFLDRLVETLHHIKVLHKVIIVQRTQPRIDANMQENLDIIACMLGKVPVNVLFTGEKTPSFEKWIRSYSEICQKKSLVFDKWYCACSFFFFK